MNWLKDLHKKLETSLAVLMLNRLWQYKWVVILAVAVFTNACYVAVLSERVRNETAALEQLKDRQYELEMEWESLRLEQGTLAEHNRIENIANKSLNMARVKSNSEIIVDTQ